MYPESIQITPVANGYVVTLPKIEVDLSTQAMDSLAKTLPSIIEKMQADPTLSRLQEELKAETKSTSTIELLRCNGMFVFEDFEHVLAFLAERFIQK